MRIANPTNPMQTNMTFMTQVAGAALVIGLGLGPVFAEDASTTSAPAGGGGSGDAVSAEAFLTQLTERDAAILHIREQYEHGTLSLEEAKRQLWPYAKEDLTYLMGNLDEEIVRTQARLDFLQKAKKDPTTVLDLRVKELLGIVAPEERPQW